MFTNQTIQSMLWSRCLKEGNFVSICKKYHFSSSLEIKLQNEYPWNQRVYVWNASRTWILAFLENHAPRPQARQHYFEKFKYNGTCHCRFWTSLFLWSRRLSIFQVWNSWIRGPWDYQTRKVPAYWTWMRYFLFRSHFSHPHDRKAAVLGKKVWRSVLEEQTHGGGFLEINLQAYGFGYFWFDEKDADGKGIRSDYCYRSSQPQVFWFSHQSWNRSWGRKLWELRSRSKPVLTCMILIKNI